MTSFQSILKINDEHYKVLHQNESKFSTKGKIDVFTRRVSDRHIVRIIGFNILDKTYEDFKDFGLLSKPSLAIERKHFCNYDYRLSGEDKREAYKNDELLKKGVSKTVAEVNN